MSNNSQLNASQPKANQPDLSQPDPRQPTPAVPRRPHHHLSVHRRIGALPLAVDLQLSAPWTVFFGPSGSGKSSLLRAACGLLGQRGISLLRFDDHAPPHTLQDATTFTPPHRRAISWAPQIPSLFPHLTVRQNIAFSPATQPGPGAPAEQDFREALIADAMDLFRLHPLLNRRPLDISGGERQRVNLARAFASPRCRLMLLDEPFNGIDRAFRDELLPELRACLLARRIPVIAVTHDVEEAFQLQAEIILLREGKLEAQGPVSKVLAPERDRLLASLSMPR